MRTESSRNLGDPGQSLPQGEVRRLNGLSIGKRMLPWGSDPFVVLGARESRVHGEGMGQNGMPVRRNILCTQR
jgi:hypothetical protein